MKMEELEKEARIKALKKMMAKAARNIAGKKDEEKNEESLFEKLLHEKE